jgi:hypothetical protein
VLVRPFPLDDALPTHDLRYNARKTALLRQHQAPETEQLSSSTRSAVFYLTAKLAMLSPASRITNIAEAASYAPTSRLRRRRDTLVAAAE